MNHTRQATASDMPKDHRPEKALVLRYLGGRLCARCGSQRYFLLFRMSRDGRNGILAARCSRCREPMGLTLDELEQDARDQTSKRNVRLGNSIGESHDT